MALGGWLALPDVCFQQSWSGKRQVPLREDRWHVEQRQGGRRWSWRGQRAEMQRWELAAKRRVSGYR